MAALPDIEAYVERIALAYHPERIILFGSHAYGNPTADSDVDLLVVMPFEGKAWRKASGIRLNTRADFPLDLLVRTLEQLAERLEAGDPFFTEVASCGKVIYAS